MSRLRELGTSLVVTTLSASFGVALLQTASLVQVVLQRTPRFQDSVVVAALVDSAATVFVLVALFTAGVVVTNTFSVVVAGRVHEIALRRLLGSSARDERWRIARSGLAVGAIGAVLGSVVGTAAAMVVAVLARSAHLIAVSGFDWIDPLAVRPALAVVAVAGSAGWIGSRRVLTVSPVQALGAAEEPDEREAGASRLRSAAAAVLTAGGASLLVAGVLRGQTDFDGVQVAALGGAVSFAGIVLGAHLVLPRLLRVVGRLLGRSAVARLAAANAVRQPMRSTRSTVGLLVAVTLITTFAVALRTFGKLLEVASRNDPQYFADTARTIAAVTAIFSALIGFSALIAAVGLVDSLSLSVLQRRRELGLLRVLGFSGAQLRQMLVAETAQLVLTATVLGLALGTVYGWAGAEAMLGAVRGTPGITPVAIPWSTVAAISAGAVALTFLAPLPPVRRAARIPPIEASTVA